MLPPEKKNLSLTKIMVEEFSRRGDMVMESCACPLRLRKSACCYHHPDSSLDGRSNLYAPR